MITKFTPGLKHQWSYLKVMDAFTEFKFLTLALNSAVGQNGWHGLKEVHSFDSFSPHRSVYLVTLSPQGVRVEPKQKSKRLRFTEPSPWTELHLIFTTALGGKY